MTMPSNDIRFDRIEILIVDDNRHMLAMLSSMLKRMQFRRVRVASDAASAFREMKVCCPDLVICDWSMEPLDGMDFVRLVRTGEDSPRKDLPVLMLTGHTEAHRVFEARKVGVDDFLAKPIAPKTLEDRIRAVLRRRSAAADAMAAFA